MSPELGHQYRAIGARLARYVREASGPLPSTGALQALAADLAAEHNSLVLPLKDLVSRPVFRTIAAKAGSGGGAMERHALLLQMGETFSPQVVSALAEVLSGLLDLPGETKAEPERQVQVGAAEPVPAPLQQSQVPTPWAAITAVIGGGLLAAGALVLVVSRPEVCGPLGLCSAPSADASRQVNLEAAENAEQELRRAQSLQTYRQATEQLEQELLRLGGSPLSPAQLERVQQLRQSASQAREILRQEERDQQRLDRARQIIEAARTLTGPALIAQLDAAMQELEAVPPRSFSATAAQRLREQLLQLRSTGTTAAPAGVEPPTSPDGNGTTVAPAPAPAAPSVEPPQGNRDSNPTPSREQPLF
ncbi:MAG: hypothetical protein RLZZ459_1322 [Cyanobacteriota bacterium]